MVKSAVQVCIRTRPTANFAQNYIDIKEGVNTVNLYVPKKGEGNYIDNQREHYAFKFDKVLHNSSQDTVYDECARAVVTNVVDGYNGTLLCYGQTGAGKTFTMTGGQNYKQRGIIPRSVEQVFQEIHNRPENMYTVKISYLEIYNETLVDLLSDSQNLSQDEDLQIMEDSKGSILVRGLRQVLANDEETAFSLMFQGETNRSICEHQLNKGSTRSHCIFTIYLESRSRVESEGQVIYSKLNLVDLAGSERVGKTQSKGLVLKEAMYINKSLTFLEQVVIALSNPTRDHIPYRQSKLTHFLKDSLGGNCKTLMISNIWGEQAHLDETVSTLKFATRMMRVANEASINVQTNPEALIRKYEQQIKELKQELAMHDQLKGINQVTYDPYSEEQRIELRKYIKRYVAGQIEEIEIKNLRQIKEIFMQFKVIMQGMESELEMSRNRAPQNEKEKTTTQLSAKHIEQKEKEGVGNKEEDSGFGVGKAMPNEKFTKTSKPTILMPRKISTPRKEEQLLAQETPIMEVKSPLLDTSKPKVDKTAAYEQFKLEEGAEINKALKDNMNSLAERKKAFKEISLKMNDAKKNIDTIKLKIDEKKQIKGEDADDVVDEEEMLLYKSLKEAKKVYREAYDQRNMVKSEVDYITKVIDNTRQKLVSHFNEWFGKKYEGQTPEKAKPIEEPLIPEDKLDDGEKFEKVELERIQQQDPEALAFYRAQKKTEMSKTLGASKPKIRPK